MRKIHSVTLEFFQDDANGEYGLAHSNAIHNENPFNAFYNGVGMFHDIFEHWFEDKHPYFMGDNSFNIGGEMAAMGAAMYMYSELGVYNRPLNSGSMYSFEENRRLENESSVGECIREGYCNYGYTLESGVPKQKPVDSGEIEYLAETLWDNVKNLPTGDAQEHEDAVAYKDSVTYRKIADLHRWGYRKAASMFDNNCHNQDLFVAFIEYWDKFCKQNNAEGMMDMFKFVVIDVYKDRGELSWKATLSPLYTGPDYVIQSSDNYVPCADDFYALEMEEEY